MAEDAVAYDKAELRAVIRAFKVMDEESIAAAKTQSSALADYLQKKIQSKAHQIRSAKVAGKIADGSRVSKSSKIGEISFGFAGQKFSGGGTTQQLWGGSEFGSNKYKQFSSVVRSRRSRFTRLVYLSNLARRTTIFGARVGKWL